MTSERSRETHRFNAWGISSLTARVLQLFAVFASLLTSPLMAAGMDLDRRVEFNIPAQELGAALLQFSHQAQIQVIVNRDIRGEATQGVRGQRAIKEALHQLLEPAGLRYRVAGADSITIAKVDTSPNSDAVSDRRLAGDSKEYRFAQSSAAATDTGQEQKSPALEEVIVTATRRSESTLRVPLSVVALNTEGLVKSNIKSVADIATLVPGITYTANGPQVPAATNVSIRGIVAAAGDAVTGFYLDDTEITGMMPAVFDLERVEVLRGPQGTLFGASAMGGALRFIQNRPGLREYTGRATAEVGLIEGGGTTREAGAALGGPIIRDRLGFRLSAWGRQDGGYIDRFDPIVDEVVDRNSNRVRTLAGNAALTWAPIDAVRITPAVYWQKTTVPHGGGYHEVISDPGNTFFQNGSSVATPIRDRFSTASLTVEADLGFADLISITSRLRHNFYSEGDLTLSFGARLPVVFGDPDGYGNPLDPAFAAQESDVAVQIMPSQHKSFSQEVRLASSDPGAALTWTVGGYYSKKELDDRVAWPQGEPGTPPLFGGFPFDTTTSLTQKQLSGFAQTDLRLFEGFKVTAGVRVSRIEVKLSSTDLLAADPVSNFETGVDTPVNPKWGAEYQITPRNLVYVSAGKGFRAGGVNLALANVPGCREQVNPSYDSDSLWSYEIGTKNRLFDDRMTLVASAFHIKWADMQTAIFITACGGGPTVNAGAATVNGFDAAASFTPAPGLRADLSVAYADSQFSESLFDSEGAPVVLDGYAMSSSISPWTFTASFEYSFPLAGHGAFFRAEDSYRSRNPGPFMFQAPGSAAYNTDLAAYPAYNLLNLRTGVQFDDLQVALFMTNALNAHPALGRTNLVQTVPFWFASTITPRTLGVNLNYQF